MKESVKKCIKCLKTKPLTDFAVSKVNCSGRDNQCKKCKSVYCKQHYIDNKERYNFLRKKWKTDNPEKVKIGNKAYRENNPHQRWASSTIASHKRRGCTVDISSQWLAALAQNTTQCQLCGDVLDWSIGRGKPPKYNHPTLDRIHNEKHLAKESVMIICYRCNMAKGQNSIDDTLEWAGRLISNNYIKKEVV